MKKETVELEEIYIPENVLKSKRYFGFRRRNIIEGVISAILVIFIVCSIPFVLRIKMIFCIVLGASTFFGTCVGIKGMSLSEIIIHIFYNKGLQNNYHMRSIKNGEKKKKFQVSESGEIYTSKSLAEKTYDAIKKTVTEIKGKI